jgi:hypothetical protein
MELLLKNELADASLPIEAVAHSSYHPDGLAPIDRSGM